MLFRNRTLATAFLFFCALSPIQAQAAPYYEATGRCVAAGKISQFEAERCAMTDARRRILARAVGVYVSADTVVKNMETALSLLQSSVRGITYDESWHKPKYKHIGGTAQIVVQKTLRAKVRGYGNKAPDVTAKLNRKEYGLDDDIRMEIMSAAPAHVALFALQADDKVAAILPPGEAITIYPGRKVLFPPVGVSMRSAPLPGHESDVEAIILVASGKPLLFDRLAKARIGTNAQQTAVRAIPLSKFNQALASLGPDLAQMKLLFLAYRITR